MYLLLPFSGVAQVANVAKPAKNSSPSVRDSAATTPAAPAATPAVPDTTAVAPVVTEQVLTGTVVNETDKPVAGVTVTLVADPNQVSITNAAGGYIIHSKAEAPELRVSCAGYQELQVAAGATPLVIKLVRLNNYERQLKKRSKAADKAYRKP